MSHNKQKKIAAINDMSGFGRCSLAVSIPIISHLKVQCCGVPTSIFSNHTGFENYFFDDYTDRMQEYIDQWKNLDLRFEGILSGFLGSEKQINIVEKFINDFRTEGTKVIIDPVMGDNGKRYSTYTEEMCRAMTRLTEYADILTPNLTEACILTGKSYKTEGWKMKELEKIAEELGKRGPGHIVITGICQGSFISNLVYQKDKTLKIIKTHAVGTQRSGTGDVFSSIIAADAVNGVEFTQSVKKASGFVKKCIEKSVELDIPKTDGVCFEEILYTLK